MNKMLNGLRFYFCRDPRRLSLWLFCPFPPNCLLAPLQAIPSKEVFMKTGQWTYSPTLQQLNIIRSGHIYLTPKGYGLTGGGGCWQGEGELNCKDIFSPFDFKTLWPRIVSRSLLLQDMELIYNCYVICCVTLWKKTLNYVWQYILFPQRGEPNFCV